MNEHAPPKSVFSKTENSRRYEKLFTFNKFKSSLSAKLSLIIGIFTFVVLFSCDTEVDEDHKQFKSPFTMISVRQFKSETNLSSFKSKLALPIKQNANAFMRGADLTEFLIDTVAIVRFVAEDNSITYSFKIYKTDSVGEYEQKYNLIYRNKEQVWEYALIGFKEVPESTTKEIGDVKYLYDSNVAQRASISAMIEALCLKKVESKVCDGSCERNNYFQCDAGHCRYGVCYIVTSYELVPCLGSGGGNGDNGSSGGGSGGGSTAITLPQNFEFLPNIKDLTNITTVPIEESDLGHPTDPCIRLDSLMAQNGVKEKLLELKGKITEDREFGYSFKRRFNIEQNRAIYTPMAGTHIGSLQVSLPVGDYFAFFMHSHPFEIGIPLPSFGDLMALHSLHKEATRVNKQYVTSFILGKHPDTGATTIYSLHISDTTLFQTKIRAYWNRPTFRGDSSDASFENYENSPRYNYIEEYLSRKYNENRANLQATFLREFADFGIELYKTDDLVNFTQWKKVTLTNEIPCP